MGVRAEVDSPAAGSPREGRLEVSVDVLPLELHRAADTAAAALQDELEAALSALLRGRSVLDWTSLCILPGHRCWVLGLDCVVISDDGGLLDALSLAAKAALADVTLPELCVLAAAPAAPGEAAGQGDFELGDATLRLNVAGVPLAVTVSRFGGSCLVDACAVEAQHADAALWVAVGPQGGVNASGAATGSGQLAPEAVEEMSSCAREAAAALHRELGVLIKGASSLSLRPALA